MPCLLQERFIEWVNTHENVHWVPMIEMARDFRRKNEPATGAKMPSGYTKRDLWNDPMKFMYILKEWNRFSLFPSIKYVTLPRLEQESRAV